MVKKKIMISGDEKVIEDIIKVISRIGTLCNGDSFREIKVDVDGSRNTRVNITVDGDKVEETQDNNFIIM